MSVRYSIDGAPAEEAASIEDLRQIMERRANELGRPVNALHLDEHGRAIGRARAVPRGGEWFVFATDNDE